MNEGFKKTFWEWLQQNTHFYLARKHHEKNIEDAIDHCIKETKGGG